MLKSFILITLATLTFAVEATKPSVIDEVYAKAIEANAKDVYKNYDIYLKSLEVANQKIIKSLEATKADLNDTKKFTKLSISERADALKEVDKKIEEVKKGALGSEVVARGEKAGDLLGDKEFNVVGKWQWSENDNEIVIIDANLSVKGYGLSGKVSINKNLIIVKWENNTVDTIYLSPKNKDGSYIRNNSNGIKYKATKLN